MKHQKHAVVTLCVGNFFEAIGKVSHPLIQAYCDRIGADFICVKHSGPHSVIGYAKFDIVKELLGGYERVLYLDTDILIRSDSPDIFNVVPYDRLGLFDEGSVLDRSQAWKDVLDRLGYPSGHPFTQRELRPVYYNTGVIVASKHHAQYFTPAISEFDLFGEQSYLNARLWDRKAPVFSLPYRFNRIQPVGAITGECWDDSYFAHFAGNFFSDNPHLKEIAREFQHMAERFARNEKRSFTQRIRIDYQGALGDIVSGEPLIRFLCEEMYPDETVTVRCTQPEVLAHIQANIVPFGRPWPEREDEVVIIPIPRDVQDPVFHIMHPLDFMSIKSFKGMIPKKHRRIKLKPADEIPWAVRDHVLIHFGKSWTSKAFPADFCNGVIKGLLAKDIPVALIGNHTVDGLISEDTLDLRGDTSLPQLFKVISDGALLISNDSSPVHIAGAFDKPCIMIPSCKHPDHIWPDRSEELNITIGNPFPFNYRPNKPREVVRVDEATEDQLWSILPPIEAVVDRAVIEWKKFAGVARRERREYNQT